MTHFSKGREAQISSLLGAFTLKVSLCVEWLYLINTFVSGQFLGAKHLLFFIKDTLEQIDNAQ